MEEGHATAVSQPQGGVPDPDIAAGATVGIYDTLSPRKGYLILKNYRKIGGGFKTSEWF